VSQGNHPEALFLLFIGKARPASNGCPAGNRPPKSTGARQRAQPELRSNRCDEIHYLRWCLRAPAFASYTRHRPWPNPRAHRNPVAPR
jgi:hypothetical protein